MTRRKRPRFVYPALERAIKAAEWITDTDEGATRVALRLAADLDRIDDVLSQIDNGQMFVEPKAVGELVGKKSYTASTLLGLLKQLELTPETRRVSNSDGSDPLAALRSLVERTSPELQGLDGDRTPEPHRKAVPADLDAEDPRP